MTTQTVRIGRYPRSTERLPSGRVIEAQVISTPQELRPAPGMFVMLFENTGARCFARLTGRAVTRYGDRCPTIERFAVDTVVEDGAIVGVPGDRVPGTFYVHPASVVTTDTSA